uniref:Uncharacterized protein n=1 Tax=Parascaris equorum TaxID=6256 RepID=A0A914S4P6_PAREQ
LNQKYFSVEPRDQLRVGIERVLKECGVGALRVTIVSEESFSVIEPARISLCICATLNNVRYISIVHGIMALASDESHNVADVIASCQKIASTLYLLSWNVLMAFTRGETSEGVFLKDGYISATLEKMGLERWTDALSEQRGGRIDYLFYVYELLKFGCKKMSSPRFTEKSSPKPIAYTKLRTEIISCSYAILNMRI